MSLIQTPWTSQPQQAVGIDWSNPITLGLVVSSTPNAKGLMVSSIAPSVSEIGVAFPVDGRSGYIPNGGWKPTSNITVLAYLKHKQTGAYLFGCETTDNGFGIYHNVGGQTRAYCRIGSSWADVIIMSGMLPSGLHGFKYDGATFTGYRSGLPVSSQSISGNITNSNVSLDLNGKGGNGSSAASSEFYLFCVWNRALSDAEIRSISQNPWQIFKPLPRRIFVPVATGGGTTAVTSDHSASYTITGSVAADASAAYAIRAAVTADATASYALRAAAQADQAAAYAIRAAVASDLAGSYAIQSAGTVTTGLDAAYAVRGSVAGDISVGYQIAAAVQAEVAAAYAVRAAVQKDLAAGYAIQAGLGAVSADLIAAYVINGSTTTRAPSGAGPSIILPGGTRPGSLQTFGRPPNLGGRRH